MDTMVKVTNLINHKSTIVRINDRGPFVRGRIIDCSYRAGKEIGLNISGVAKVEIEVLGFAGNIEPKARIHKITKKPITPQKRIRISNFAIQVGAFRILKGAKIYQHKFDTLHSYYKTIVKDCRDKDGLYRVLITGFSSENEAQDFRSKYKLYNSFIISN
jgi:rare lipoprotein A